MAERELIRRRRAAGQSFPWTEDEILRSYKFTNVFRHYDKTSMKLRETFYEPHFPADRRSVLMNCALFRYFGTFEFAEAVGWQDYDSFDFEGIKETARRRLAAKERVFTGAYVVTNQGISAPKQEVVVDYFLRGLHEAAPEIAELSQRTRSWKRVAEFMRQINGFGGTGFMTKEVLLDTTYTGFWSDTHRVGDPMFSYPHDWQMWTPVGPGARRGAARVMGDDLAKPVSESKAHEIILDLCESQCYLWEFDELVPTDIQFQLCEFDKYERVRLGQGRPRSKYRA